MVLLAKDIMETAFLAVDQELSAYDCAQQMVAKRKGYAIIAQQGVPHGIVTEWDYLEKIIAKGADPHTVRVREIASPVIHACAPETPTDEVVTQMATLGIRRMVVRSGDRVVGVITARLVLQRFREYVDKLSSEIAGYHSDSTTGLT
jgi:signal-transduction protein with cAMP-binding, CBS, and nucleotidyltransferase domain